MKFKKLLGVAALSVSLAAGGAGLASASASVPAPPAVADTTYASPAAVNAAAAAAPHTVTPNTAVPMGADGGPQLLVGWAINNVTGTRLWSANRAYSVYVHGQQCNVHIERYLSTFRVWPGPAKYCGNTADHWDKLIFQTDGNLVLYGYDWTGVGNLYYVHPEWGSNTVGRGGVRVIMQNDGNFVMYNSVGYPLWASGI